MENLASVRLAVSLLALLFPSPSAHDAATRAIGHTVRLLPDLDPLPLSARSKTSLMCLVAIPVFPRVSQVRERRPEDSSYLQPSRVWTGQRTIPTRPALSTAGWPESRRQHEPYRARNSANS